MRDRNFIFDNKFNPEQPGQYPLALHAFAQGLFDSQPEQSTITPQRPFFDSPQESLNFVINNQEYILDFFKNFPEETFDNETLNRLTYQLAIFISESVQYIKKYNIWQEKRYERGETPIYLQIEESPQGIERATVPIQCINHQPPFYSQDEGDNPRFAFYLNLMQADYPGQASTYNIHVYDSTDLP